MCAINHSERNKMETQTFDFRELRCPMALIFAKRACVTLMQGEQLILYISPSEAKGDIPRYLKNNGFVVKQKTVPGASMLLVTKI